MSESALSSSQKIENFELRRTPLYSAHARLNGKFVPFGGWEMPVQYSGLIAEHKATRSAAGLFDVSHMGEVDVWGPGAREFLQYLCSNDISKLYDGRAQYNILLNDTGGVVDDIIVYQRSPEQYLVCVNASNTEKDFTWFASHAASFSGSLSAGKVEVANRSADWAQIAIQGPKAREIAAQLDLPAAEKQWIASTAPFHFIETKLETGSGPARAVLAATGYTGEDGLEIFIEAPRAEWLWQRLIELGSPAGLLPVGLGARDTLRLEAALPLYGHELLDNLPASCASVNWAIKMGKEKFIGKAALERAAKAGLPYAMFGFEVADRGIVREGAKLCDEAGQEIGWVTSGTHSPSLGKAIGLGYLRSDKVAKLDLGGVTALVRDRQLAVKRAAIPFYRRDSGKSKQ